MKIHRFFLFASLLFPSTLFAESEAVDLAGLFSALQSEGKPADEIILALVNSGNELEGSTAYSVANAASIGLAVAYAQAGVCLARDRLAAEGVAKQAVESASDAAQKAVQAKVVSILSAFDSGGCRLLADERNNAGQAFATSPATPGSPASGGGGAGLNPPPIDGDPDISASQ